MNLSINFQGLQFFATFYKSQADKFSYLGNNDQSSATTVVNGVTAAGIVGIIREFIRTKKACFVQKYV